MVDDRDVCLTDRETPAPDDIHDDRAELRRLAALPPLQYDRERDKAAKTMGVRISTLDALVEAERPAEYSSDALAGRAICFPQIEPWPQPVDGISLFDELASALRSYVVMTMAQTDAVALWCAFSHALGCFDVSPRLNVKSAQKRSGKSQLSRALHRLVPKPCSASGVTASALLRLIELHQPTMLVDEVDALMNSNRELAEALRGLINSGFDRSGASFIMSVATLDKGFEPRAFSTWCALALAGIGDLAATIRDRSIEINLKRKLPSEKVRRLRRRDGADFDELARKVARWTADHAAEVAAARPEMPANLNDRQADAWEPLAAIADAAGGAWPQRARTAALALCGAVADDDLDSILLADVRGIFERLGCDRLSSERLAKHLVELEDRPWAECSGGKPLSKFQLSRRLKKYEVVSGTIKLDDGSSIKGYRREAFDDAFSRYLPISPSPTCNLVASLEKQGQNARFQLVTESVGDEFKNAGNPRKTRRGDEVTSSSRGSSAQRASDEELRPTATRRKEVRL